METQQLLSEVLSPLEMAKLNSENNESETSSLMTSSVSDSQLPFLGENVEDVPDTSIAKEIRDKEMEMQRREYLKRPEVQAEIVYQNYVNTRILTGQQKRNLRREILRDAKRGKYMKMFDEEYQQKVADRKFSKLNAI